MTIPSPTQIRDSGFEKYLIKLGNNYPQLDGRAYFFDFFSATQFAFSPLLFMVWSIHFLRAAG